MGTPLKLRALALALGPALFAAFLTRGAGPGASAPAVREAARPAAHVGDGRPGEPWPAGPVRDPFRYVDAKPPAASLPAIVPRASTPAVSRVRLVGFVRRDGRLLAALAVAGDVMLAGVGEDAAGYAVLAADEETGVRLREPAGGEITLSPEP